MIPMVSVVIVNWNGKRFLEGCLLSLRHQSYKDFEVILVDNGSTDGSQQFVRERFPEVILIEKDRNTGFAAANNEGIKIARGKYIATLNNDTSVSKDWLEQLVRVSGESEEDCGMWAPKILSMESSRVIDSVGGLLLYADGIGKGRGRLEEDRGQYDGIREILLPSACAALYRKRMLIEIGGFDEDFFAYCEDVDLGLRARLAGWKARSVPQSVVYHFYSGTGGRYSPMKAYLVERNHLWAVLKNYPVSLLVRVPFYLLWRLIVQVYGVWRNKGAGGKFLRDYSHMHLLKALFKAYYDVLIHLPPVMRKRKEVQRLRKIQGKAFRDLLSMHAIGAMEIVFKD